MNQTPLDVTARCVRPAGKHEPQTLLGAEIPLAFLKRHLLDRTTPNSRLLPNKQTVMLYGRRGCGKNTLIHATDPSGKRLFLDSPAFGEIHDWKMRPWNGAEFAEWAKQHAQTVVKRSQQVSVLFLIQDIHHFNYIRGADPVTALVQLLTAVRLCPFRDEVRVLLTCAESPGQFPQDIQDLIDARCYVPLLDASDRITFMLALMREFKHLCETVLQNVSWSIDTSDEAVASDPDHVLNTLAVYSAETTPRELYDFMLRSFDACRHPLADGSTEYSAELLNKLKYDVEGVYCVTPYNPESKNAVMRQYANMDPEMTTKNTRICFLNKDGPVLTAEAEPSSKRQRSAAEQPPNVHQAIAERVAQQEKLLKNAARKEKAKRDREGR